MSIPNVRFCQVVAMLAEGRWKYEDAGILDRTHLRFFTAVEMIELVKEAGLEPVRLEPLTMIAPDRLPRNPDGSLTLGRVTIQDLTDSEYVDFLVIQYVVVAGKATSDRLAAARHALELNQNEAAFQLAREAEGAEAFERRYIMAKAAARQKKLGPAETLYREALAIRPGHTHAAAELGLVLIAAGQPAEARPFLERVIAGDAENDRAVAGLGLIHLAEGRLAEAFEQFQAALALNFEDETVLEHLLDSGYALGRLSEAEPPLRRFTDFYPGNARMVCRYAELLWRLGKPQQARDRLAGLMLLTQDYAPARELLAAIEKAAHETGA
jgi:tetratricopeptide (TPR) repeat protein